MRVVVLGAGVIGVTTAWYLAEAGHEVVVIERQPAAALETSFANGGQISVSHAEPWANPGAPLQILKWLGRENAPLLWRFSADPWQWIWGLRFLRQCTPARMRANIVAILRLALYSRAALQALRADTGIRYDEEVRGILHVYSDEKVFAHARPQAALMREYGCDRVIKSAAECLAIEPALAGSRVNLVGGTYTASDESGDACKFTEALAERCARRGVQFRYGLGIESLASDGERISGIRLAGGELLTADTYVAALGSYTPLLLRPLGLRLPVYPAKGYSATIALDDDSVAPSVSLTDDQHRLVFSRLGGRLRVAGTAEFAGYDTSLNEARCAALLARAFTLFPRAGRRAGAEFWAGLRPATPNNVPLIGMSRYRNLFVNTGHGTLGWTMACGSGKLMADLVSGRLPEIDAADYAP